MAVLNGIWDFIEGQNKTATLFVVSGTFLRETGLVCVNGRGVCILIKCKI